MFKEGKQTGYVKIIQGALRHPKESWLVMEVNREAKTVSKDSWIKQVTEPTQVHLGEYVQLC